MSPRQVERAHFLVANLDPLFVGSWVHVGIDGETGCGGSPPNKPEHPWQRPQGVASPVVADLAEDAMLDGIPLRRATGIMAHRDGEARVIGELLQLVLPKSRTVPIASASITFDHKVVGIRVALSPVRCPPTAQAGHCKRGRDRAPAYHHIGVIRPLIGQAVGRRFAGGVAGKVVHVDLFGHNAPARPSIFEVPEQLGLLRVHTEDGLAVSAEQRLGALNKTILLITMRVRFARETFDVGPQGILHALEQTSDRLCRGASQSLSERA